MKVSATIEINITRLELQTLESVIDEHSENIGTMDDDEAIKERKKESMVLNKLLNKIHNQIARQNGK